MPIKYYPKTGEVLICDFGPDFVRTLAQEIDRSKLTSSGRLPPEMVKERLVVVLNGKMAEGCMVVPLSSTKPSDVTSGLNVLVDKTMIAAHSFFTSKDRWASGDQIQQASKLRLRTFHPNPAQRPVLPFNLVREIQRAVIKSLRAGDLLAPVTGADQKPTPGQSAVPAVAPSHVPANAMAAAMALATSKKEALSPPSAAPVTAASTKLVAVLPASAPVKTGPADDAPKAA